MKIPPNGIIQFMHVAFSHIRSKKNKHIMLISKNRNLRVPKMQADGSGRDGFIHFDNGGLVSNYRPNNYGKILRDYRIIDKPRIGKIHPEFDDYQ